MIFLNFSQLPESVFRPNFPLTGKYFPLTNFSNGKQTQESLESGFPETTFRKTNTAKRKNTFLETKPNFSLTGKCFPLTNFPNGKQIQESLENSFSESEFRKTNMALARNYIFFPCSWSNIFLFNLKQIIKPLRSKTFDACRPKHF